LQDNNISNCTTIFTLHNAQRQLTQELDAADMEIRPIGLGSYMRTQKRGYIQITKLKYESDNGNIAHINEHVERLTVTRFNVIDIIIYFS